MKRSAMALLLAGLAFALPARAESDGARDDAEPSALFRTANEALVAERAGEAIARYEALADRGVVDAAASFNRGLAYASRVRAGAEQPGDLGRAAHGFEEARALTHDAALEKEATRALEAIRAEVARRRTRAGDPVEIGSGVSFGRAVVSLLPEDVWTGLGGVASVALALAILVRWRARLSRAQVAANTVGAIAMTLLVASSALAWAARSARLHLREGIVVAPRARLLDARHIAIDSIPALPEGARAQIVEESGGFSSVVVGTQSGYVPSSTILPLAKR